MKIAIVDSGMSKEYNYVNNVCGYSIKEYNGGDEYKVIEGECNDENGHGTAILDIFDRNARNLKIDMFKVFSKEYEADENLLIEALKYIRENNDYDIIHLSVGVVESENYKELYSVCKEIYEHGSIIVSAFDNDGAISYPAAFPFVIGVDLSDEKMDIQEYEFVENNIINIRGSSSYHRVLWKDLNRILVRGTSFSAVYITIKVIEILESGRRNLDDILNYLAREAVRVIQTPQHKLYDNGFVNTIKKAVIFPLNKENQSLVRFENLLKFKIVGVYDCKYSLKTGKRVNDIYPDIVSCLKVGEISTLDWDSDFDTFIIGHTDTLSKMSGVNYKQIILDKCSAHNKKVYSYDSIDCESGGIVYTPLIDKSMVVSNRFGKLRYINLPVLGIWGTSSRQGKFTLQLKIRKALSDLGYKVGWLSTEPQGGLFNADRVYPIGYNSTVKITDYESVTLINEYMWEISQKGYDIIMVGSQSGTVPYSYTHLCSYPVYQNDMLFATQPDYVILCVNVYDDMEYINRTIKFIESSGNTKVMCIAVSNYRAKMNDLFVDKNRLQVDCDVELKVNEIKNLLNVNAYSIDSKDMVDNIVVCFGE